VLWLAPIIKKVVIQCHMGWEYVSLEKALVIRIIIMAGILSICIAHQDMAATRIFIMAGMEHIAVRTALIMVMVVIQEVK
jgi:hypothetical protein